MTKGLYIDQISKRRHDHKEAYLFQNVSGTVQPGERIAILGKSGQGKTTLLRILARLDVPDEGEIALHGRATGEWKPHLWRKKVCYVAQQPIMLPGTVEQNIKTASELHGEAFDLPLAKSCMAAVGLESLDWSKQAADLSGGEKQRTALVRSLLLKPEILLLDEVTASLDPGSKRAVELGLDEWGSPNGTAMVWVTHDLNQARRMSGTVWFMDEGKLLETGRTEDFFRCPASEAARRFIESPEDRGENG